VRRSFAVRKGLAMQLETKEANRTVIRLSDDDKYLIAEMMIENRWAKLINEKPGYRIRMKLADLAELITDCGTKVNVNHIH